MLAKHQFETTVKGNVSSGSYKAPTWRGNRRNLTSGFHFFSTHVTWWGEHLGRLDHRSDSETGGNDRNGGEAHPIIVNGEIPSEIPQMLSTFFNFEFLIYS